MFKVGDKVKRVRYFQQKPQDGWPDFIEGAVYTVQAVSDSGGWLALVNMGKDTHKHPYAADCFELVKPEPQAAAIVGGLQEHSVGEYYPLAAVMYEFDEHRVITIENLQTGEVARNRLGPICFESFEDAYKAIEKPVGTTYWVKGRVMYVSGYWQVLEDPNQVQVTRLRNMLHRG